MNLLAALLLATTVTLPQGGEVCRFRADDRDNPFKRWLASQEVVCTPASQPIEFPKGLWNVFARNANEISLPVLVDGEAPPQTLTFAMQPAAAISATSGVAYAPRLAVAYPLPSVVPKDEALWLFTLDKSKVVAIDGKPAVIGWLEVPELDRRAIETANGLTPPSIHAGTRESDLLAPLARLHGSFFRIREVPPGESALTVQGRGWISGTRKLKVDPAMTVIPEALTVRTSGSLTVYWDTSDSLETLNNSFGTCADEPPATEIEITLSSCPRPSRPNEPPPAESCSVVRKETFEPRLRFGSVHFDELVPGFYRAELRFGKLPPESNGGAVAPLQVAKLNLNAYYYSLYGSITRGGDPLGEPATVSFPGGAGFLAEGEDDYRAVMLAPLGVDAQVTVEACDGSPRAIVLADRPMRPNTRFDIDIPHNKLLMRISDTFTRDPLSGAVVKLEVMSKLMPKRVVMTRTFTAEAGDARVVMQALPERELRISVTHAGYQRRDLDPFSMTKSEVKELDVQLIPWRGSRARIVSNKPFDAAAAYWFSPAGVDTERVDVAPDGTFVFANRHDSNEILAVVSLSHPLWIARSPQIEHGQSPQLRFPDTMPARTFDVLIPSSDRAVTRTVGLTVNGVDVPPVALRIDQQLRGEAGTIRGRGPLRVGPILETGPIDVTIEGMRKRLAPGAMTVVFDVE